MVAVAPLNARRRISFVVNEDSSIKVGTKRRPVNFFLGRGKGGKIFISGQDVNFIVSRTQSGGKQTHTARVTILNTGRVGCEGYVIVLPATQTLYTGFTFICVRILYLGTVVCSLICVCARLKIENKNVTEIIAFVHF